MDKSLMEKLLDQTFLLVVVVGVVVLIIGAAGGAPLGTPPLQITEPGWRIGVGVFGAALTAFGLAMLVRERRKGAQTSAVPAGTHFMVDTYPRSQHPAFFAEVEKLVPTATEITLIATGLNMIWEKRIADILIERAKSGKAKVTVCMGNPFSPHVLDRLTEEETTGERSQIGRDGIERNIKALLQNLQVEGNPRNFSLRLFEHYPTFATLIFDKELFVYPYAYQLLGNVSPILHFHDDGSEEAQFFTSNARRILDDSVPAEDVIAAHQNRRHYSEGWIAAAVYVVPNENEPLYRFGASVLGFDVWRQTSYHTEKQAVLEVRPHVGDASTYGFHATIGDVVYLLSEAELNRTRAELRLLADEFPAFTLSNFRVVDRHGKVGDIVLLCDDSSGVTEALHHELLAHHYRRGVSTNYRLGRTQKRLPQSLQRSNLMIQRYGSPFVLRHFNLHFTLCSAPPVDADERKAVLGKLQAVFEQSRIPSELEIGQICLLVKRRNDPTWRILDKYQLCRT